MLAELESKVPPVALGSAAEEFVKLEQFAEVASGTRIFALSQGSLDAMNRSRRLLEDAVEERRLIYGLTTGFGPLAGRYINIEDTEELQRNLVYHLASGVGRPFSPLQTRAIMAARAINLAKGHSGIRPQAVQLLLDCLEADLLPLIPCMGTVGASGDLTPLAHMTLALFGEGDVLLKGERMSASTAFRLAGLSPLTPAHREALALVNGTSAMTAVAALNAIDAQRALQVALRSTVLYAELLGGRLEAYHPHFAAVRPHAGQQWATAELLRLCAGSRRLQQYAPKFLSEGTAGVHELPQDPYTIRCAPQIFGAIADVLRFHNGTVETELNSVTDNPIFVEDDVLHGGNFYGQHVAFASDALMTAVVKLAVHSERKIARVTDETQNRGLPAFLQGNQTGLHSGFMGAQVTASAIVAEMRTKAVPASIQSIPTNANNQDVVSMGTIAARRTAELIDYLFDLLAIETLVMVQGFDICGGFQSDEFAASSQDLACLVRSVSAFVKKDRPLYADIARLSQQLRTSLIIPGNCVQADF